MQERCKEQRTHSMELRKRPIEDPIHQPSPPTLPTPATVQSTSTGRQEQESDKKVRNGNMKDRIKNLWLYIFISETCASLLEFFKSLSSIIISIIISVCQYVSEICATLRRQKFHIFGGITLVMCYGCSFLSPIGGHTHSGRSDFCKGDKLAELKALHPEAHDFWKGVNSTLMLGMRGPKPSVLLILHNGKESVANCLALNISRALSCDMNGHDNFYQVDSSKSHEISSFLEIILEKRDSLGVVVFTHLEKLPSAFARSLHFICDEDPKKSNKAIIVLVLKVDDALSAEGEYLAKIASKNMRDLWEAELDSIEPILGRTTNEVVSIGNVPPTLQQQLQCERGD